MFDTMTFTKIMGGLCGSLLVFLLGKWVADEIYATGHGHGDDHSPAYVIDLGDDDAEEVVEEGPSFGEIYAAADVASGERVFGKCKACHAVEQGNNGVGPYLQAVVGRDVGAAEGFEYSGALSEVVSIWTPEELYAFLENPRGYAPGTSMSYNGLSKSSERADVIAYLDMTDGTMTEVAVEEAAAEPVAEEVVAVAEEADPAPEAVEADQPVEAEVEPTPEAEAVAEAATQDTAAAQEATEEAAAADTTASETAQEVIAAETATEDTTEAATEAAEETAAAEPAAEDSGLAALVAAADVAKGERAYRKCAACHVADEEQNRVGPHLVNIIGRDIASVDGFNYSDALTGLDGNWTLEAFSAYIEDPRTFAPGNRMAFRGIRDEEERINLLGYLQSIAQ